jgi:ABC-2 type transport system permease protein
MKVFLAQLKRELWEHPVLYLLPIVIGAIVLVWALWLTTSADGLELAFVIGDDDIGFADRTRLVTTIVLVLLAPLFMLPTVAVIASYLLNCLGAERRDRSILFFKSLPVSDVTTVLAKLTTALLLAPIFALTGLLVTELGVTVLVGASSAGMLWDPSQLLAAWLLAVYTVIAFTLWHAPTFCFLLAVSAWARRATVLWACSPLLVILIESSLTGRSSLGRLLAAHWQGFWSTALEHRFRIALDENPFPEMLDEIDVASTTNLWSWMDPVGLLTSPMLWAGLAVASGLTAAAVALRRYRDDS